MNKKGTNITFVFQEDYKSLKFIKEKFNLKFKKYDEYLDTEFLDKFKNHRLNKKIEEFEEDENLCVRIRVGN